MENEVEFRIGDEVVYPAHGVGKIIGEGTHTVANTEIAVLFVEFKKEKMTLSIPKRKASAIGLRHLSNKNELQQIYEILKSFPQTSKRIWSRRSQEYGSKINSGNLISAAEVVRDLFKNVNDPNRSYSEKILYEAALKRIVSEMAIVESLSEKEAEAKLIDMLNAKKAA